MIHVIILQTIVDTCPEMSCPALWPQLGAGGWVFCLRSHTGPLALGSVLCCRSFKFIITVEQGAHTFTLHWSLPMVRPRLPCLSSCGLGASSMSIPWGPRDAASQPAAETCTWTGHRQH